MSVATTLRRPALHHNPITPLLAARHPALTWAVEHDVLGRTQQPQSLWSLPRMLEAGRLQNGDGSWAYHGGKATIRSREDYDQLATYAHLLVLVSEFRLDRRHPPIERAAAFLLARQTAEGDIRGIYGAQYSPNSTADILRLLIEAGYRDNARVVKGLDWLIDMRQEDGGWAIPARTAGDCVLSEALNLPRPLEPNRSKPSAHLVTGIVLRALAAHPSYRHRAETRRASLLLAGRFFKQDTYLDRKASTYWTKLCFPFRWTDLVSSLDAIALAGLKADEPDVAKGLAWLVAHQRPNGLWRAGYPNSPDPLLDQWVTFAAARVFKRFGAMLPPT
jgi:hypothetical protein